MENKNSESHNLDQSENNRFLNSGNYMKTTIESSYYRSNRYDGNEGTILMYFAGLIFLILLIISIFIPNAHLSQLILFVCTITCIYVGILFSRGSKSLSN